MALWVVLDDSVAADELIAGAAAAAISAAIAEMACRQAGGQIRIRARWLVPALRLPWLLCRDTGLVFAALWLQQVRGREPLSRFCEEPARYGPDTAEGRTRRSLLVGGLSVAPTRLALGLDRERGTVVLHELRPAARKAPA